MSIVSFVISSTENEGIRLTQRYSYSSSQTDIEILADRRGSDFDETVGVTLEGGQISRNGVFSKLSSKTKREVYFLSAVGEKSGDRALRCEYHFSWLLKAKPEKDKPMRKYEATSYLLQELLTAGDESCLSADSYQLVHSLRMSARVNEC